MTEIILNIYKHKKKASQQGNSDNENQEVETVMSWNDIVEDEDIMGVY